MDKETAKKTLGDIFLLKIARKCLFRFLCYAWYNEIGTFTCWAIDAIKNARIEEIIRREYY